jgi:hypothetical protein
MSALMGVPQSLSEHDVTAQLPEFATSSSKSLALEIHIKLARATSSILQSKCYMVTPFMKSALIRSISHLWSRRPGTK